MTTALLDRETERTQLRAAWRAASSGTPQLAVIWGRRRVGKTFLLSHFIQNKRAVFFGATAQSEPIELSRLVEAIGRDLGPQALDLAGGGFPSWEAALRFLAALAADEPLAIVIDEAPYLTRSTPGFPSIVQVVWDHLRPGTKLLLILTGSSVGVVEAMLGSGGALRGRPTLSIRLEPIDLRAARLFLPDLDAGELIEAYAACGGYPLHLRSWDQKTTVEQNLMRMAMTPGGILLDDATGILHEELPETGGYSRILAAIGRGRSRLSDIANEAAQRVEHPLDILQRGSFVRRSVPIGAPRRTRPIYEIDDPYLAFWFSVLYSDRSLIEAGQGRAVLRRQHQQWQRHVGWVFEEAARRHAVALVRGSQLPDDLAVGRWWTTSGQPVEVDVLGLLDNHTSLVGEARWQQRALGPTDLHRLAAKLPWLPKPAPEMRYALWGRSGVSREVARAGALGFSAEDVVEGG